MVVGCGNFEVTVDNNPDDFRLILNQALFPSASPQIKASESWLTFWYALYAACAKRAGYDSLGWVRG